MDLRTIISGESLERREFFENEVTIENAYPTTADLQIIAESALDNPDKDIQEIIKERIEKVILTNFNKVSLIPDVSKRLESNFNSKTVNERLLDMLVLRALIKLSVPFSLSNEDIELVRNSGLIEITDFPKTGNHLIAKLTRGLMESR